MKFKKVISLFLCSVMITMLTVGCNNNSTNNNSDSDISSDSQSVSIDSTINKEDMFTDRDIEIGYDEEYSTKITSKNNSVSIDGNGAKIDGCNIIITDEGTYIFNGDFIDSQVVIEAENTDKIQIVLDGVNISNPSTAPIYVKQADKVFITLANESENSLSVTGEFVAIDENNIDAAIYSKDDITINGNGKLIITNEYGNGITSKDDMVITSGTYDINTSGHGIEGKDSVRIANGNFTITSGKDGIHSENSDDTSLGFIYIVNGTFSINAQGDGIDANNTLDIDAGEYNIVTCGGSSNAIAHTNSEMGFGFGNFHQGGNRSFDSNGNMNGNNTDNSKTEDTVSTKGFKATGNIIISSGVYNIDSCDDSIHSNSNIAINNGTFEISSGDDGIHADNNTSIIDGTINITKSYEGIEGQSINIAGGKVTLIASDDGLNASGGNDESSINGGFGNDMFATDESAYIEISGGIISINADGDGVDSNGNLTVTGGETYVCGPTNNGNGALDYNGTAKITGGILVAVGSSGMAQNFGSTSTQCSMLITTQNTQSEEITVKDDSGNEIFSFTPEKQYNSVVISIPELIKGKIYNVTMGSDIQTVEMSNIIYGSGNGMGDMNPGRGDRPKDMQPPTDGQIPTGQRPDGMQPPIDNNDEIDGTSGATPNIDSTEDEI